MPGGSSEASPSKRKRVSEIRTTSGNTQNTQNATPVTEINCCNLNEMIIEGLREDNSKLETALKESLKENEKKGDTIQSLNAKIAILEQMLANANISSDIGNQNNDSERCNNSEEITSENSTVLHAPDMLAADLNETNEVVETTQESAKLDQQSTLDSNELATHNNTFSATEPALGKK
jgi:hypothetical protein